MTEMTHLALLIVSSLLFVSCLSVLFLRMNTELRYCNLVKQDLVTNTTHFVILDKPLNHSVNQFLHLSNEGVDRDNPKVTFRSLSLYFHDSKDFLVKNCELEEP